MDSASNAPHVCFVVEIFDKDRDGWRIAYAGETARGELRWGKEHKRMTSGASRVVASIATHGRAVHRVRIVDVVEDAAERKALETYLMMKHETVFPNVKNMRDLLAYDNCELDYSHPDIQLEGKPLNFQLNQVRSVADQTRIDAAGEAYMARCAATTLSRFSADDEGAMFDAVDADLALNEAIDEPLERAPLVARAPTAAADAGDRQIVFDVDSAFMCARAKRVEYEHMTPSDVVHGEQLFRDVKAVRDLVVDDDLKSRMRQLYLAVHPDKQASMVAGAVFHLFGMLEQLAGVVEEAALVAKAEADADLDKHLKQAKAWRAYMRANDGTPPTQKPTSVAKSLDEKKDEKYLGMQMMHWRGGHNGGPKQLRRNAYIVFLRDFELFAEYCYGKETRSREIAKNVNAMLRLGYGTCAEKTKHPHLMSMTSRCVTCKQTTKEHQMWGGYLGGENETNEAVLLANLPPERVATAKKMHDGVFKARKAAAASANKKQTEAFHATGLVEPRAKKAKVTKTPTTGGGGGGGGGSSSSSNGLEDA